VPQDLNISVDEQEDEEEESGQLTPAISEGATTVCASPRAMKLRRLERNKLIIIMVGLPGRGKTFL
jgi:signal recognition particle GTPase